MLYVEKRKGKNGEYFALVADLGYIKKIISFDKYLIAELLDMSIKELNDLPDSVRVGRIEYNKEA